MELGIWGTNGFTYMEVSISSFVEMTAADDEAETAAASAGLLANCEYFSSSGRRFLICLSPIFLTPLSVNTIKPLISDVGRPSALPCSWICLISESLFCLYFRARFHSTFRDSSNLCILADTATSLIPSSALIYFNSSLSYSSFLVGVMPLFSSSSTCCAIFLKSVMSQTP